ncbi:MAG: hypothetical protein MJB14_19350 [Spirochaetes bacterium]|nr:hypothetical protein [Spirochaetota bacterium]
MLKKVTLFYFLLIIFSNSNLFGQQNSYFVKLSEKDLATFNDAISLMRLLYDEKDVNTAFIDNILWAASKKLFRVTIPIKETEVNPIIKRKEFCYWLCKIFQINKSKFIPINRMVAYNICLEIGIVNPGRGPDDSFSGMELLETFSYFDNYVRLNQIKQRSASLVLYEDEYDSLPEWRKLLYKELTEQRAKEQAEKEAKKLKRQQLRQQRLNQENKPADTDESSEEKQDVIILE